MCGVYTCVYRCMDTCGGICVEGAGVFFSITLDLIPLRKGLSLNYQQAPVSHLSLTPSARTIGICETIPNFLHEIQDLNSVHYTCTSSIFNH